MTQPILLIPGLGNSGPAHWQSYWERLLPNTRRVIQTDWDQPNPGDWVVALDQAISECTSPPLLVAHSLGCAVVARWSQHYRRTVQGALLVSPSDVDSPAHTPEVVRGFSPLPLQQLPFPSIVVASSNDPYVDSTRAEVFAQAWGSQFVNIGAFGHINADSQLEDWQAGQGLLRELYG